MNVSLVISYLYLLHILSLKEIDQNYITLLLFMMFKMIFNYDKCTISYMEVKLRGVRKDQGYLYRFLDGFIRLRDRPEFALILFTSMYILYTRTELNFNYSSG